MHRPFEALAATLVVLHPLASASCSCIVVATVTITTPNNASADTIAITANVVSFISRPYHGSYCIRISATRLQNERFSIGYV
jgi:hypothetical protein